MTGQPVPNGRRFRSALHRGVYVTGWHNNRFCAGHVTTIDPGRGKSAAGRPLGRGLIVAG